MPVFGAPQYPYPNTTKVPDVPGDILLFAQRLALMNGAGIAAVADISARNALVANGDAFGGLHVYVTADETVYKYDGANWPIVSRGSTTFTPSLTGWASTGGSVLFAEYKISDGFVQLKMGLELGSAPTVGDVRLTPPVPISTLLPDLSPLGSAICIDTSATVRSMAAVLHNATGSTARVLPHFVSGTTVTVVATSSTVPFTWASGDELHLDISYPA